MSADGFKRVSFSERLRRSISPRILLRTAAVAVVSVAAGPLVLMVVLLLGGTFLGGRLAATAGGALVWATIVATLIVVISVVLLIFGIIAVGTLHRLAHLPESERAGAPGVGRALLSALRALPGLMLAFLLTIVALLVVTILALPVSVAALVVAAVLFVRNARVRGPGATRFTRGTRIALVAAIPSAPSLALLCLMPALLAATLDRPRSVKALFSSAINVLQRRVVPLVIFIIVSASVTAGLTWVGTAASRAMDGGGTSATGLLVLAGILAILLIVNGAALAIIIASTSGESAAAGVRVSVPRRPWRRTMPLNAAGGRVAMLLVIALIVGIVPVLSMAPAAQAATATAPVPLSSAALIDPVLNLGLDASSMSSPSPLLTAEVTVPAGDPTGTVQFFDGTVALSGLIALTGSSYDSHLASADLNLSSNPLDPGVHQLSFTFTPASTAVSPGTSAGKSWTVLADTVTTVSTDASAAVNGPATVTVTVAPAYATSVKPDGTVDVTINGTTETLPLAGGTIQKQVAVLQSPDITAVYSGSSLFNPSTGTDSVGAVIVPEATQAVATFYNPPFTLGTVINASVVVTAPSAAFGTVVKGVIQAWAGPTQAPTLLAESSHLDQWLNIPTVSLHAGATDIRFLFVPDVGFAPSETTSTITIVPARTHVTTALQPIVSTTPVPRGSANSMTLNVSSDLDGLRTVQVFNTRTVNQIPALVATGSVTITGGRGTGSVDLTGRLLLGVYDLVATVVGDADHASATSASQTESIGAGLTSTTLTVSASPVEINTPITLVARTTSATGDSPLPGHVIFILPDRSDHQVGIAADGTATYVYTPTQASSTAVRAEYFDPTFQYGVSSASTALVVTMVSLAAPTVTWTGDLTPSDRTLNLIYAAAQNRGVPTGFVRILDATGSVLALAALVNGTITLPIFVPGAHPVLRVQYVGDSVYAERTDLLPVSQLRNYTPVIVATAPASVALGSEFPVTVDLSAVPLRLLTGVSLSATNEADNTVTNLGPVTLDLSGHGVARVTLFAAGTYNLRAVASFTGVSELATATSDPATITVQPVPVPELSVTRTDPSAALVPGGSVDVTINAAPISGSTTGLAAGVTAQLLDANNSVIGTTILIAHNNVFGTINLLTYSPGLSGTVTIANLRGGPLTVHATVVYGPLNATATSPVLEIAIPAPATELLVTAPSVTVGQGLVVTVGAYPGGNLSGISRSLPATVTVLGVLYPVTLTRTGGTGVLTGTVTVPTQHAGFFVITAATPGDGVDTSAATTSSFFSVSKRITRIVLSVAAASQAGVDVAVSARVVQDGIQSSAAPTGTIVVSSLFAGASGIQCASDGSGVCVIPGRFVRAGQREIVANYGGDADNGASYASTTFTATPRISALNVTFSPTRDNWVAGQPITATWTTTTSGTAAVGRVDFTLAGRASCSGPAVAGSCTLTPATYAVMAPVSTDYRVDFTSSDDAPNAQVSGTVGAKLCAYPVLYDTVDYGASIRCGTDGLGVITGSVVHITGVPLANNKIGGWTVDGVSTGGTGYTLTFEVTGFNVVYANEVYGPTCFRLHLYSGDGGGVVSAITRPNCTSPFSSTAQELADLKAGAPQYAAGTTVELSLLPSTFAGPNQTVLDSLQGATRTSEYFAQVVVNAEQYVNAGFRIKACVVIDTPATEGGSVSFAAITKSYRNECSVDGKAGYVPGTVLMVYATPDPGATFSSWLDGQSRNNTPNTLKALATRAKSFHDVVGALITVPWQDSFQLGAQFSMVKCVSVTIVSQAIRDQFAYKVIEPAGATWLTQPGGLTAECGGVASTTTTSNSSSGAYHLVTTTDSIVAAGQLIPQTTDPRYQTRSLYGALSWVKVIWGTNSPKSVQPPYKNYEVDADGTKHLLEVSNSGPSGPFINLDQVDNSITITARWVYENCAPVAVSLPQGGSYLLSSFYGDENFCERNGELPAGTRGYLRPATIAGSPNLVPFTSVTGGTVSQEELVYLANHPDVQQGVATVWGGGNYRLEYCASIGLNIQAINDAGQASPLDPETVKKIVLDDGGCPPLYSRPGRTVSTSITVAGQYAYTVVGSTDGTGPSRVVDAQGNVSGPNALNLTINCTTLTLENVAATTPGNCPGGASNRYLRGTTVQLQADGIDSDHLFEGWYSNTVDASQDQTAWVIMDHDRHAVVGISTRSTAEKIRDGFSSLGQRMLAAVITISTGVSLAELWVAKVAAIGLKLGAAGLRAAGAGGAIADAIDKAGTVVQAQVDLAMLASTCLSNWANGSGQILTLAPSTATTPTLGAGAGLPPNATAQQIFDAAKADLQTRIAAKTGYAGAVPIGAVLGDTGTFINVVGGFSQNLSLYSGDAKTAWSSYASSMNACMAKGVDQYVKDTYTGY